MPSARPIVAGGLIKPLIEENALSRPQRKLPLSNIEMRKTSEQDVEAFLAAGKKIQIVPMGVTGQDKMGRSKNIVISRKRRATL